MFLFSKNGEQLTNMDNVLNIFVKDEKVAVSYINGSGSCAARYQSFAEAKEAMVTQSLALGRDVRMPNEADVKAWMANQKQNKTEVHHYANGQKTRSHGGS